MSSKSNTFRNDILRLIFNGVAIANLADNAASAPLANLYAALHTADPGAGGNQETSEITYTSYARVAIERNTDGWTVTADTVTPTDPVEFPEGTGGSGTATHVTIGTHASGTGKVLYRGALTPPIVCGAGITPRATSASTIQET